MTTTNSSKLRSTGGGFQRWMKLSTDDLPLIRPPRHHMLAHVTGGLTSLYEIVKDVKKEDVDEFITPYHESEEYKEDLEKGVDGSTETSNGHSDAEKNGECNETTDQPKDQEEQPTNSEEGTAEVTKNEESSVEEQAADEKEESSQNEKKDDEGGGEEKAKSEAGEEQEEEEGKEKLSKTDDDDFDDQVDTHLSNEEDDDGNMEEEEETTPYTDEEGEFSPEKDMALLAGRFRYTQVLARGQSAIIIKVLDTFHKDRPLAIKVLHRVYKPIGSQEADILLELHRADPWLHVPFARLLNQFLYGPHYCLVFEYLSPTPLYTHYDHRDIREATALPHIRDLTVKLLTVLGFLYKQNVIHADLKPENILLKTEEDLASLMVVDFGNALRNTDEELSLYYSDFELQTLLYRAPEVIFGMKFSLEVDMWSLGCLLAECYLGEPLFMGKSKKEILNKITGLLGPFPKEYNDGEYSQEFSDFIGRPMSRYQRLENLRKRLNDCKDSMFLMLVERLLTYLPDRRFTPFEAACHPFVACSTPFLYLTPSPGYIRYPTVLLDISTYPYLPGLPDDEDEDSASAQGRRRLALFTRHKKPQASNAVGQSQKQNANQKDKDKDKDGSGGKTATRSDVKETLKSMGLRCEDFTISVYSREQAHAILKKQGVEVTPNNIQAKDKLGALGKGGYKNAKSGDSGKFGNLRTGFAPNARNMNAMFSPDSKTDDDDDCVILDPPDMPKSSTRLPQQFQLMGTTVQVNRGAKRGNRPMVNQPQAKRSNSRPMMYYRNEHEQDGGSEASVQDTLKRLKNYNISITCRRNASGMRPQGGMMDSESDMENDSHLDSDDDGEDMTKYLECQIGEIDDVPPEEAIFEDDFDIDCDDKDDVDYNPRGKKRKPSKKSPKKGKKNSDSGSTGDKNSGRNSGIDEFPDIVPSVEMSELSDPHASNPSENEFDHDPLAEDNENSKELRDILENAAQMSEEQGGDGEDQIVEQENNAEEKPDDGVAGQDDEAEDAVEENMAPENNETTPADVLSGFVETESGEEVSSPPRNPQMADEDIDEELEKQLLGGELGETEGMQADL
ncbi:hypothetical protein Pmani_021235 [Petrolisthes manimaculis]|uniref:Protein kinase domain-containing protein n=1 Tax=Petrolisthes manimaculis TaxID=1843537 RepID=A0AAE1PH30_9EUCA|nr:hypothetical protein Pmani_021235 [Petrolisthes manimaculis]